MRRGEYGKKYDRSSILHYERFAQKCVLKYTVKPIVWHVASRALKAVDISRENRRISHRITCCERDIVIIMFFCPFFLIIVTLYLRVTF